jgi:purine-nucleoside phosphorylase
MNPEQIDEAVRYLKKLTPFSPTTGIILGTGLGALVDDVKIEAEIAYGDIPHFATSTVESHKGKLIFGTLHGVKTIIMQGRFHFYEGYNMKQVVFPIYVMKQLGIQKLLISNIAGSINPEIKAGHLVIINDHINLHAENSLRGKNFDELGPRFPDMFAPYTKELIARAEQIANENNIVFHHGVYVGLQGPNLETPAEYRYLRLIGGDCVGMSTIPEAIACNHLGLPVFALSVITDEAFPEVPHKITLEEILGIARNAEPLMTKIIAGLV